VFNFGVKADKTQHALWRLEQLPPASIDCGHAVVLLGANNLGAGDTGTGIAAGVAAVVASVIRVAPRAKIHVVATPPCGVDSKFRAEVRLKAKAALMELQGFETIDVDDELIGGDATLPPSYLDDGIHFTEAGYRRLTKAVLAQLNLG
jgi:lysophospholipase L1-like esterase